MLSLKSLFGFSYSAMAQRVLYYRAFSEWIAGSVGLRSSRNRHACWHTTKPVVTNLVNHGWQMNLQRPPIERKKMCLVAHISSFPDCGGRVIEQLSVTMAHKSEGFQTACRWLMNDGYIERQSAMNTQTEYFQIVLHLGQDQVRLNLGPFCTLFQLASCNYTKYCIAYVVLHWGKFSNI